MLAMGACAPVSEAAITPTDEMIGSPATVRMVSFGFDVIKRRYLNDVQFSDLGLDALDGLTSIDPALAIERSGSVFHLAYENRPIGDYHAPEDEDADAWATFLLDIVRDAGRASPAVHAASNDDVYQALFTTALSKLDRFSRYAGPTLAREHRAARNGFGGIGVRYKPDDTAIVLTEVMPDGPAGQAGLKVGARISRIDGKPVDGLEPDAITRMLRGPVSSQVALTVVETDSAPQTVSVRRALIIPPTVRMTEQDGIATIAVSGFNQGTTAELTQSVRQAKAEPGFKGIVLDLRGNPGGLLDQGVGVADLFMEHGRIVSTRGRNPASVQVYDAKPGDPGENVPLVVLVDGKSASASEIVASALQDSGRAVLVGTNSYGKGTVQTVVRMPNDGEMTLTWSRFISPSGYALHGLGVLPAVCTADDPAEPATLAAIREAHSPVPTNIALWRGSTLDEHDLRAKLRSTCPKARHEAKTDDAIGRDLLSDSALYRRALALTAPPMVTSSSSALGESGFHEP